MQILQAVPLHAAHRILAAVHARHGGDTKAATSRHADFLVRLLPRSFHPAIVRACCIPASDTQSCAIVARNHHLHLAADTEPDAAAGNPTVGAALPCTATFKLLAAAAPLAGGSIGLAYTPGPPSSSAYAYPAASTQNDHERGVAMDPERPPQPGSPVQKRHTDAPESPVAAGVEMAHISNHVWQLPGGYLTKLELSLPNFDMEPPRWCAALCQLRTLRCVRLSVKIFKGVQFGVREFTDALHQLPVLEELELWYLIGLCGYEAADVAQPATLQLLDGISRLPHLATLALHGCINFPRVERAVMPEDADGASSANVYSVESCFAGLARLSMLTSFTAKIFVTGGVWPREFARAVKTLPALHDLHITLSVGKYVADIPEAATAMSDLLADVIAGPGLPRLQHFGWNVSTEQDISPVDMPVDLLHAGLLSSNEALLARMTALQLGDGSGMIPEHLSGALAALVADLPALQLLDVSGNRLKDSGLIALAAGVRCLRQLTDISIGDNGASYVGVCALLTAMLGAHAAGGAALRRLSMPNFYIGPGHAVALTSLLRQFRALEVLDVGDLDLDIGDAGTRVVVDALATLPHLRCVNGCVLNDDACDAGHGGQRTSHTSSRDTFLLSILESRSLGAGAPRSRSRSLRSEPQSRSLPRSRRRTLEPEPPLRAPARG